MIKSKIKGHIVMGITFIWIFLRFYNKRFHNFWLTPRFEDMIGGCKLSLFCAVKGRDMGGL